MTSYAVAMYHIPPPTDVIYDRLAYTSIRCDKYADIRRGGNLLDEDIVLADIVTEVVETANFQIERLCKAEVVA